MSITQRLIAAIEAVSVGGRKPVRIYLDDALASRLRDELPHVFADRRQAPTFQGIPITREAFGRQSRVVADDGYTRPV